ncbi:MAG: caspase family protein [Candidatus Thermoplasmatota archaeon]|nr:caspase family protein [Candidatus Thermoplasmatota archaeon]
MKRKIVGILMCMLLLLPVSSVLAFPFRTNFKNQKTPTSDGTEYWALLVGVNEFKNQPYMTNLSLFNGQPPTDLDNLLLASNHWKADHIRLLTGKNASIFNVCKGFRWLCRMADADDICLVYFATHGSPIYDMPPVDENGGYDTALYMYDTYRTQLGKWPNCWYWCFPNKLYYLYDDTINRYLNRLKCDGVCLIIEACFAGGFNDTYSTGIQTTYLAFEWMKNLGRQLSAPGRVILMACNNDELSNGNFFGYYLMEGLQGFGDVNKDGLCSAEEAFNYSTPKTKEILLKEFDFPMSPQIFDSYPGELILTDTEMPPTCTNLVNGSLVGQVGSDQTYFFNASDPEDDQIKYHFNWGDTTEEWTGLCSSDEPVEMAHVWDKEGTYNVLLRNYDEHGMWFFEDSFPRTRIVVTIEDDHCVDQRQTELYDGLSLNDGIFVKKWYAQSFVPTQSTLSKVELELIAKGNVQPITVSIRKELTGPDLTSTSVLIGPMDLYRPILNWTTFDFPDISVAPGDTYYIVCHPIYTDDSLYGWSYAGASYDDPYPNGQGYSSPDYGSNWIIYSRVHDFSFVTYGG